LSFNYRKDLIEILGTNYADDDVFINEEKGLLNIAWYDSDGIALYADASIVEIRVRVLTEIPENTELFKLNAVSELADPTANPIVDINLKAVGITTDNFLIVGDELITTNYPNPFIDKTTIQYILPEGGKVKLEVYDVTGKLVATLVDKEQEAGIQIVEFIRTGATLDGIYFYRVVLKNENRIYSARKSLSVTQNPHSVR
ncbi:MAG: hypothetical protein DRI89_05090, partial [Bacteroidetes bacterium]